MSPRAGVSSRAQRGICFFLFIVTACGKETPPAPVDIQPMARLELDSNRTVEVIGLRRWTADMVRDSLKKYAPDEGLDSDGTAANLRNLLGFADASTTVHSVVFDEDEKATITLAVREPGDSARVHYQPQSLDTLPAKTEWLPYSRGLTGGRVVFPEGQIEAATRADSLIVRETLAFIASRRSDADFDAGVKVIDSSRSMPDRAMAALILARFPERDQAWRSLLKAAVGLEQASDASIAQRALVSLSQKPLDRAVDWLPMTATIHDVLDGTALAALAPLAQALVATGASPAQASAYLANGGEMVAAAVESDNPDIRDPAHDLLVKLHGGDLGFEPGPWRDWIRRLKAPSP